MHNEIVSVSTHWTRHCSIMLRAPSPDRATRFNGTDELFRLEAALECSASHPLSDDLKRWRTVLRCDCGLSPDRRAHRILLLHLPPPPRSLRLRRRWRWDIWTTSEIALPRFGKVARASGSTLTASDRYTGRAQEILVTIQPHYVNLYNPRVGNRRRVHELTSARRDRRRAR
jgi:hypothetical protein